MIFAYDRIINGKPVPNGYPRNFKYIESVDEYTNYFKKEPTVHEMFEYSTPIIESDKVDTDFIYPIHQYGAVEKLIGRDEKYAEFCFFHHIKPKTLDKIRKKQGIISILAFEESRVDFRTFTYLHELCNKFEVPTDVVNYITGHNYTEIKKYKRWCSLKKEKPILIVNSFSQMYMKGGDLAFSKGTFVTGTDVLRREKRKHQFLCFNRRIRPPRYAVMAMLHHNNLIKNNLISFSIEKIPNLNCLGHSGFPDLPTMVNTMGRDNDLIETYMNYYNDLMEMSPLTVDFPNLLDVMGPGCENKEPYLNTYFSIVTETPFNEKMGMTSEKVWRPMLHFHPFIVHGSKGTLKEIRKLGFKTFEPYIDESYDDESDNGKRMQKFTDEVIRICSMSEEDMHDWYYQMMDILIHNQRLILKYGEEYVDFHTKVTLKTYKQMRENLNV
tara:strand:- start:13052 stop:14371 length:1320 start_codon:yes stop_codon:yes gene_type:complete